MERMTLSQLAAVLLEAEQTGRPIEFTTPDNPADSGWTDWDGEYLWTNMAYRVQPKPREWWLNIYDYRQPECHATKKNADGCADDDRIECVHVREVLDDEVAP